MAPPSEAYLRAGASSKRVARSAGAVPKRIAVSNESATVKARTCASGRRSSAIGADPRETSRTRDLLPHWERRRPRLPPSADKSTDSVSNCRTKRPRPAPIASRTAISRCRADARASKRFATLAQAIIRTSPTTDIRMRRGMENRSRSWESPRLPSSIASRVSRTSFLNRLSFIPAAIPFCMRTKIGSSTVRACPHVSPGASRPTMRSQVTLWPVQSDGGAAGCTASGVQISGASPTVSPKNSGGATPTMVKAVPLKVNVWPSTLGSRPKRRCQYPWLITAIGFPSGSRSSSGSRARPRTGRTPRTEK